MSHEMPSSLLPKQMAVILKTLLSATSIATSSAEKKFKTGQPG